MRFESVCVFGPNVVTFATGGVVATVTAAWFLDPAVEAGA